MDNNIDNKKIIQMVAIIGFLCLFVGIATRIRQNGQKTLADFKPPSSSTTVSDGSNETNSETDSAGSSTNVSSDSYDTSSNTSESIVSDNASSGSSDENASSTSTGTNNIADISPEEYDAFYYVDNEDGTSTVKLLYYNTNQEIKPGILECSSENAYEIMLIFYKLYKNHYEFTSIIPLSEYDSEEASRITNNTYCNGKTIYINPLYNPQITYENGNPVCIPSESENYMDRTKDFPYIITTEDYAYILFTEADYYWGGNRNGSKDYAAFGK